MALSTIVGIFFAIIYLIFIKNFEASCVVFFYSLIGGLVGGLIGSIFGYYIGVVDNNTSGSISVIDGGRITAIFVAASIWILGIIIGALIGGFRGMNTID